tara:strand:+ start:580 stop:798 length:219 start_codon:yes stop_codon:yes gene_type:complete
MRTEIDSQMWDEIDTLLIDNFDRLGMDLPSNFEQIVKFVYWDIYDTADRENWHDGDVVIGFRRWIESQSNEQ